jgi:hypothetical protein
MASLQCQLCGAAVTIGEPIGREAQCESCRNDLRCCRNCRHYDPRYNNACTEPMADPVVEKERRNFCEYFYFSREPFRPAQASSGREAEARKKLNALFGGAPGVDRAMDARRKLDDLFRKRPDSGDDER